ncbi:glycosyltransferase family 1 protein [Spirosoma foliorum]|uniref:Glycosyltransferase family 1 protein n=1 Tax=Spirosoma foliorum TaxID=2710596 RepID=A0A7G5GYL6_9BACT|nr:glycosyltransferase family 1 protein [Spirosoma foliorum]QMW03958.1 glycosyltransferase family 1 protein [Spirosoma foliorum]
MTQYQPNSTVHAGYQELAKSEVVKQSQSPDESAGEVTDLLCFSHLRWNFVYQRPQHLLSRASQNWRVWFIEEPIYSHEDRLEFHPVSETLTVVVPFLKHGTSHEEAIRQQREAVNQLIAQHSIRDFIAWYYTPMALSFSDHLTPRLTIYDCMDELSAFLGAPRSLLDKEKELLNRADLVFTGGMSLYEAKKTRHDSVFAFPSSIDYNHFEPARHSLPEPADVIGIAGPRIGFCGVIDERMNIGLLGELAQKRPDWQFVLLGPVVKINPAHLPKGPNLHYLGMKPYENLPAYFNQWDVAMMPFALNEATRYISPTKTPEYLAAGLPVVSTSIQDVISTYGGWAPVLIADTAEAFEQAIDKALHHTMSDDWTAVDAFLLANSWDSTWEAMNRLILARMTVNFQ